MRLFIPSCRLVLLSLCVGSFYTKAAGEVLEWPADQILLQEVRETPMPDTGDSRIGKILNRFYKKGLGGRDNWESIISMRSRGVIRLESGVEMDIEVYQRKPDQLKLALLNEERSLGVSMAYDGEMAWKQVNGAAKPEPMDPEEARRFIHSSIFGNHLLFPFALGKKIEYLETIPVEETICHKVRVHLDTGYQVDYYIDVSNYHELRLENLDLSTGKVNTIHYRDYTVVSGMPMAMQLENYEDGQLVSMLELSDFKVNVGIMPWMFRMPDNTTQSPASTLAP